MYGYFSAPDGCFQYFTGTTGTFQTFNFMNAAGNHIRNQRFVRMCTYFWTIYNCFVPQILSMHQKRGRILLHPVQRVSWCRGGFFFEYLASGPHRRYGCQVHHGLSPNKWLCRQKSCKLKSLKIFFSVGASSTCTSDAANLVSRICGTSFTALTGKMLLDTPVCGMNRVCLL